MNIGRFSHQYKIKRITLFASPCIAGTARQLLQQFAQPFHVRIDDGFRWIQIGDFRQTISLQL
ncbi:hypothetical protein, partial [Thiolapillus sp.]